MWLINTWTFWERGTWVALAQPSVWAFVSEVRWNPSLQIRCLHAVFKRQLNPSSRVFNEFILDPQWAISKDLCHQSKPTAEPAYAGTSSSMPVYSLGWNMQIMTCLHCLCHSLVPYWSAWAGSRKWSSANLWASCFSCNVPFALSMLLIRQGGLSWRKKWYLADLWALFFYLDPWHCLCFLLFLYWLAH